MGKICRRVDKTVSQMPYCIMIMGALERFQV